MWDSCGPRSARCREAGVRRTTPKTSRGLRIASLRGRPRRRRMPKLEVFQSLWAMELRRPDGRERTHEESFEMVAAAGYHGMAIDLATTDVATARKNKPLFERHGLGCLINAFPRTIEALRPV